MVPGSIESVQLVCRLSLDGRLLKALQLMQRVVPVLVIVLRPQAAVLLL